MNKFHLHCKYKCKIAIKNAATCLWVGCRWRTELVLLTEGYG